MLCCPTQTGNVDMTVQNGELVTPGSNNGTALATKAAYKKLPLSSKMPDEFFDELRYLKVCHRPPGYHVDSQFTRLHSPAC